MRCVCFTQGQRADYARGAVTPYTMLHLALAGAFFVLALLHFATWVAVRTQRVQLWLASSFLGFAVLALATGLTSHEASAMVTDTRLWLMLGILPSIPLPYTLLRVAWSLLDVPLTLWRRVMLVVALVLGVVRVLDVTWSLLTLPETGVTAEALSQATARAQPAAVLAPGDLCGWDLGRRSRTAPETPGSDGGCRARRLLDCARAPRP